MEPSLYRLYWKDRRGRWQERLCRLYADEVEEAVAVLSALSGTFVWIEEAHVFALEDLRREWLWRCPECDEGAFALRAFSPRDEIAPSRSA